MQTGSRHTYPLSLPNFYGQHKPLCYGTTCQSCSYCEFCQQSNMVRCLAQNVAEFFASLHIFSCGVISTNYSFTKDTHLNGIRPWNYICQKAFTRHQYQSKGRTKFSQKQKEPTKLLHEQHFDKIITTTEWSPNAVQDVFERSIHFKTGLRSRKMVVRLTFQQILHLVMLWQLCSRPLPPCTPALSWRMYFGKAMNQVHCSSS